jgi:heptosyltransferase II
MRVLVVKLGAIGDVIMSLTIVSALRAQRPAAHLTWIVGRTSRPILELIDGIDAIVEVDEQRLFRGGMLVRASEILAVWRRVAGKSFDLVITGHPDPRYRLLTLPVSAAARRGFARQGRDGPLPGRMHSHEYARLVSGSDGPDAPVYQLPVIARRLPPAPFKRDHGDRVVVLASGGARNVMRDDPLRRWPVRSYAALAQALVSRGYTVVLVGAPHDRSILPEFAGVPVIDLIGRTTLPELAATFGASDVVVTHDSLALHMAGLARTDVVALFGPTSPAEKVPTISGGAGLAGRVRVIWGGEHLACRPCYDGRSFYDCKSNKCMSEIAVSDVLAAVEEIFAARGVALAGGVL